METRRETVLRIEGMTCQHCVHHVTSALKGVPGVKDVAVRLSEGEATVTSEAGNPPTLAALVEAVQEAGYEASAKA